MMYCFSYTVITCYNSSKSYPLMIYMEYPFLVLQDLTIVFLILHYDDNMTLVNLGYTIAYGITAVSLARGALEPSYMVILIVSSPSICLNVRLFL